MATLVTAIKALLLSGLGKAALLGATITLVFSIFSDDKTYYWGFSFGEFLSRIGSSKLGKATWERIETGIIKTFGALFRGIKDGLNSDDEGIQKPNKPKWLKKVRK